jgi:folate-binding protein YgfZ
LRARRISAGIPEWGEDYRAGEVFPTDINMDLMDGVDYRKGCFVGQEVASRMKRKGLIRKRTVHVYGAELEPGAELRGGETVLGAVTSAAGGEALALVRTDRLAKALQTGGNLSVNGAQARLAMPDWLAAELKAHAEAGVDE